MEMESVELQIVDTPNDFVTLADACVRKYDMKQKKFLSMYDFAYCERDSFAMTVDITTAGVSITEYCNVTAEMTRTCRCVISLATFAVVKARLESLLTQMIFREYDLQYEHKNIQFGSRTFMRDDYGRDVTLLFWALEYATSKAEIEHIYEAWMIMDFEAKRYFYDITVARRGHARDGGAGRRLAIYNILSDDYSGYTQNRVLETSH